MAEPGTSLPQPPTSNAGPPSDPTGESGQPLMQRLGLAGLLGIGALILPPLGGFTLIAYMPEVSAWLKSHQDAGIFIYTGAFIVLAGLALLPTYAQAALGGFAFGMFFGLPAALLGFTGGAALGYEIARRASGDRVLKILREKPKWQAIRDALVKDHERRSFWKTVGMVALLRCPPNSPFALTNLVMASVRVPRAPFALGTCIGMIPRTAVAVYIGHAFGLSAEGGFDTPLWLKVTGIVAMLVVLVVVMEIAERAVNRMISPGERQSYAKTLPKKIAGVAVVGGVIITLIVLRNQRTQREQDTRPEGTPAPAAAPANTPPG